MFSDDVTFISQGDHIVFVQSDNRQYFSRSTLKLECNQNVIRVDDGKERCDITVQDGCIREIYCAFSWLKSSESKLFKYNESVPFGGE